MWTQVSCPDISNCQELFQAPEYMEHWTGTETALWSFQSTKWKQLFSFYCALCPRAETDSTTTFSFTIFLICCTKIDIFWGLGEFQQYKNNFKKEERETFGFEQRELENRTTRAQEILSFQNVVSFWITTKPQKFPNSPWNGNSESLGLEMLKQGVSDTSSCPRHSKGKWLSHQLAAALLPASLRMRKAFWGHLHDIYSGASPRVTKLWALLWQHSSQMDFLGTAQLVLQLKYAAKWLKEWCQEGEGRCRLLAR